MPVPGGAVRILTGASLAGEVTGAPHALDEGTRLGSLVLRALAEIFDASVPATAYDRRMLWERAGVAADELSSPATSPR